MSFEADSQLAAQVEAAVWARQGHTEGTEVRFSAPCHQDGHPSARWNSKKLTWYCDVCKVGGGIKDLAERLGIETSGTDTPAAPGNGMITRTGRGERAMAGYHEGLTSSELQTGDGSWSGDARGEVVARFDYQDAQGHVIYQSRRVEPGRYGRKKEFFLYRRDGNGWTRGLGPLEPVLYRLPLLLHSDPRRPVYIPEGEAKVDAINALGEIATTNPNGASGFRAEYARHLSEREVIILPDNDAPGLKHANDVAHVLEGIAKSIRILRLPGLPDKGDIIDWLNTGGTRQQFIELSKTAPYWTPSPSAAASVPGIESARPALGDENYHLTDTGNAKRLVAAHGRDLRHCTRTGEWYVWDGQRWREDTTAEVMRRAERVALSIYHDVAECGNPQYRAQLTAWAKASESAPRLANMVKLASAQVGIAITADELDGDPWLFNVANGTVDLRTGGLGPHRREQLLTKMAPVIYDPDARSDLWEKFLEEVTGGDKLLIAFLQRAVGYSLTGSIAEEKLFFVHGPAATGKSTIIEALKAMMGDYAKTADFEAFLRRNDAGGPRPDIARLAGARFVSSVEVDEGKRLAEGLVKQLTGGDSITARFLYSKEFTFTPQMKLWLAANHAPRVNDSDSAMWRRILRLPFDHVIPPEKRDPKVKTTLCDREQCGPALLSWAIEGCLAWQKGGLGVPPSVVDATESYRKEMDPLAGFFEECCELGSTWWTATSELRRVYEAWARENGERHTINGKEWSRRLREKNCHPDPTTKARGWRGIGLVETGASQKMMDKMAEESMTPMTPNDTSLGNSLHEGNTSSDFTKQPSFGVIGVIGEPEEGEVDGEL